ncbi:hypothetical protein COOONC_21977 [Cooperia oncophora]
MIIRNTTSRQLAPFKLPLATFALSCIILSATFVLCQPCVLLQNDVILIVLMGPAIFIHPAISSICFVIFQATLILCTLQVASPYLFKILAKKDKITPLWQIVSLAVPFVMTWLVLIVPLVVFSFKSYGEIYDRKEAYQRIVSAYNETLNWTTVLCHLQTERNRQIVANIAGGSMYHWMHQRRGEHDQVIRIVENPKASQMGDICSRWFRTNRQHFPIKCEFIPLP